MHSAPVVVFDLGKVLVDFDYSIAARRVAAQCPGPADPVGFFSSHTGLLGRYELGRITTAQFFEEIRQASGFSGSPEEFAAYFADIFTEIPEMTALHAALRRAGLRTWIFSNTNDLAVLHIRRRFPFFANFDGYVFSYQHNSMKPSARLYEVVEETTGCSGSDLVYIDDRPENIETGRARGWRAVLHESPAKTLQALRAWNLPVPA
jgi:HAD superfamily hydrolase (TIGR01509 family)